MAAGPVGLLARVAAVSTAVLGLAVGSLLMVDGVNRTPRFEDPGIASVDTTRRSRLLILHLDSWRYQTAIDPALMPRVARLRTQGASWELETVFEGFTVPAVRAAFSGHAETQLVSLIHNFRFRTLPTESFFNDVARIGKRTLVIAVEPFVQFGPHFEQRAPDTRGLTMYEADRLRPDMALRGYQVEGFDVVVCHYESADWVAHEEGIGSDRYRREFDYADSLIAAFAAARHPGDYLLVYGDHGHSPTGEHKTGIQIPTFGLLLGPDVTPGVTTERLAMANLRYIASHAMGITLRAAPYDTEQLARFLPIAVHADVAQRALGGGPSRRLSDYATAIGVAIAAGLLVLWLASRVGGTGIGLPMLGVLLTIFAADLAVRQWLAAQTIVSAPSGVGTLIPLYVAAFAAKLIVLAGVAGRTRWIAAAVWTALVTLLELRVWDSPWAYVVVLGAVLVAWRAHEGQNRRLEATVALYVAVYFTLRLSLYQLAWIDVYLGALWLVARNRDNVWVDAAMIVGAYTLTCGWLASSLEWGFLYTLFPAHLIELQVQYFLPFILAKLPLLLVLSCVIVDRAPTRRLVLLLLAFTALRFAAVWALRLLGASGAEIWPFAEQGIYLTTFVIAAAAWGWHHSAQKQLNQSRRAA